MTMEYGALKRSGGRWTHAAWSGEARRTRNLRVKQSHKAEGGHASQRMLP
jgi:hypothetical protein